MDMDKKREQNKRPMHAVLLIKNLRLFKNLSAVQHCLSESVDVSIHVRVDNFMAVDRI